MAPYSSSIRIHSLTHTRLPTTNIKILYLKAIFHVHMESMPVQRVTSRGQAPPGSDRVSESPPPLPPLSCPLLASVSLLSVFFVCVMCLPAALSPHSVDTFTTFWWVGPAGRWASPSGVITGGVGMLMIAVVIWLLWQFRGAGSSMRMFRLERLREKW